MHSHAIVGLSSVDQGPQTVHRNAYIRYSYLRDRVQAATGKIKQDAACYRGLSLVILFSPRDILRRARYCHAKSSVRLSSRDVEVHVCDHIGLEYFENNFPADEHSFFALCIPPTSWIYSKKEHPEF